MAGRAAAARPVGAAVAVGGLAHPAAAVGRPRPVAAGRWPTGAWLRTAFGLTCVGLVTPPGRHHHPRPRPSTGVPWGNMYEFIAAITCMAVLVLVAAAVRFRAYYLGLFVLLPVVLALALDVTVIYTPAGSLVPALNSYWLAIHVTAMIVASGLYIVGAVVTVAVPHRRPHRAADRWPASRRGSRA